VIFGIKFPPVSFYITGGNQAFSFLCYCLVRRPVVCLDCCLVCSCCCVCFLVGCLNCDRCRCFFARFSTNSNNPSSLASDCIAIDGFCVSILESIGGDQEFYTEVCFWKIKNGIVAYQEMLPGGFLLKCLLGNYF